MGDPFEVLGISPDAGSDQIKAAYRALARKFHPDHFPEGPERNAAEEKMIQLNRAYEEANRRATHSIMRAVPRNRTDHIELDEKLSDVRSMMAVGQLENARRTLMQVDGRSAEWNYLYGAILMRMGDYAKATVYFGISARMMPESAQYRAALRSAESLRDRAPRNGFQRAMDNIGRKFKRKSSFK